jgi:low molecular weight protein-tyrosine phosphatase
MPVNSPAPPQVPPPRQPSAPYKVCLVCLGNICRSPMAEIVLRDELARAGLAGRVSVDSAGTGDWHIGERMHGPAREELARRGYDGSAHRARQIQRSWLAGYDLLVAMDRNNLASLRRMAPPEDAARIQLLRSFDPALAEDDPYDGEVPDPYGAPQEYYALALDLVLAGARGLARQLAELLDSAPQPRA